MNILARIGDTSLLPLRRIVPPSGARILLKIESENPLISDLYEGGYAEGTVARTARLIGMGVNVIVLLALSDSGRPSYNPELAARIAALGAPVVACTPDQFPALMAAALRRQDLHAWAATEDIKLVRPPE